MRKRFLLSMLCLTAASMLLSSSVFAAISGSDHDFSGSGWSGGESCKVCHTPHTGKGNTLVPLWNHATTSQDPYLLYDSSTLDAAVGQPTGSSKACLSCHDGTVAVDSFGDATGTYKITGNSNVGTDLSNDHPVSFTYDTALATTDPGLKNPSEAAISALLKGTGHNRMECSSCHDVHNSAGVEGLLVKSNAFSALCLTCHAK